MFDPLGLNKEADGSSGGAKDWNPESTGPALEAKGASHGSPKLWLSLLVIDIALVVVFGGLLAEKIYQHLSAPMPAAVSAARRKTRTESPKPPEVPKPAPTKLAELPKAPEPAKPLATPSRIPTPKPSMVQGDAPTHASAAPLEKVPAAPPAKTQAPASAGSVAEVKTRAVPVEFRLHAPGAKSVALAGAFLVHGGKKVMTTAGEGNWEITLYLKPGTYRYTFLVNGKKKLDPDNTKTDRGASVILVTGQ